MLAGGIIGAGIFSLPYVITKAGLLVGLGFLAVGVAAYCIIHLMYADIVAGSTEQHRFVGYISKYFGSRYAPFAIVMAVVEMIFVLLIYLVLTVSFLKLLFPGVDSNILLTGAWIVGSATIFLPLRRLTLLELLVTGGIVAIVLGLFGLGIPHLKSLGEGLFSFSKEPLLPLAAIFFSLSGRYAIPPLVNYLRKVGQCTRATLRQSVLWGTVIPGIAYLMFVVGVIALSPEVSADALTGVAGSISSWVMLTLGTLGVLTLWSSYILVGLDVHDTLRYDLHLPLWLRLVIVVLGPLLLYLLGFTNFISLIGFAGGVFLAIEGLCILMLWHKARAREGTTGVITRMPRVVTYALVAVLLLALASAIITQEIM